VPLTGRTRSGPPLNLLSSAAQPGWIVLTGGMTDAVPIRPGARIAAHVTHLGTITRDGGADADH
jgi:2-oxo-3-hexenedioate decarboxylase